MLGADGDEFEALYCKINYDPNCPFYGTKEGEEPWDAMFDTESKRKYLQSDGTPLRT